MILLCPVQGPWASSFHSLLFRYGLELCEERVDTRWRLAAGPGNHRGDDEDDAGRQTDEGRISCPPDAATEEIWR